MSWIVCICDANFGIGQAISLQVHHHNQRGTSLARMERRMSRQQDFLWTTISEVILSWWRESRRHCVRLTRVGKDGKVEVGRNNIIISISNGA